MRSGIPGRVALGVIWRGWLGLLVVLSGGAVALAQEVPERRRVMAGAVRGVRGPAGRRFGGSGGAVLQDVGSAGRRGALAGAPAWSAGRGDATLQGPSAARNEAPSFVSETATLTAAEDTASGENLGGALTATDPDRDPLEYTQDASGLFAVHEDTGQVRLGDNAALDHETAESHALSLEVSDGLNAPWEETHRRTTGWR